MTLFHESPLSTLGLQTRLRSFLRRLSHSVVYRFLWNKMTHYRVHKDIPLDSFLSLLYPVQTLAPPHAEIHVDTLQPTHRFSKPSLPFRFSEYNVSIISHISHEFYMSTRLMILDLITLIILGERTNYASSCNWLHCFVIDCLLGPNVLLRTACSLSM
jgi:hypothetical protein